MKEPVNPKFSLNLEVKEVERNARPGCNTSTTSPRCTCPIFITVQVC
jgi:hypothetical protein